MRRIDATQFWQWAFSDFLTNSLRGVLAEYIVAQAIECTNKPRVEWDAYDLITDTGVKIEVKSSAYLQSWQQLRPSTIRFDIASKRGWNAETNIYAMESTRAANIYVFCVFMEQDRKRADPLDLTQWFFLVCTTAWLNEHFPAQKSVSLSVLEQAGLSRIDFYSLRENYDKAASSLGENNGPSIIY